MLNDDDLDVRVAQPHHPADLTRLASFDQYRSLLLSIAYRMLGSVSDAEDMLQETFIRWQQTCDDDIRSPRAFLVTIISRLCINHLQSARVKREEYVGQWLPEPLATDPGNNPFGIIKVDESLSLAFLLLLERLTPVERAVFLLREVFEYEYSQIADVVDQSEANCRQILRRARQHVSAVHPRFKPSAQEQNEMLERFRQASASGDMDQLLALFSKDIVLHSDGGGKAIALPNLVYGADRVARAIERGFRKLLPTNLVQRILQVNGAPSVVSYCNEQLHSTLTLDAAAGRIRAIYIVTNPEKLAHLPPLPL
jgi:RNA polymerase sigma-70 factor (ECF subfamily)